MKVTELARMLNTQIVIRYPDANCQWYARLESAEIPAENGHIVMMSGRGPTAQAAVVDYVKEIAGKHIVVHAYSGNRAETNVPLSLEA